MLTTNRVAAAIVLVACGYGAMNDLLAQSVPMPAGPHVIMYRHASTLQEGMLRGQADLLRAQGDFNYNTALGAMYFEQARANYLQNLATAQAMRQARFERIRRNHEAAAVAVAPRVPPVRGEIARRVEPPAPKRLAAHEFDPANGVVAWPVALKAPVFQKQVAAINRLLADKNTLATAAARERVRTQLVSLTEELIREGRERRVAPMDQIAAKNFLQGMTLELQSPRSATPIAHIAMQ